MFALSEILLEDRDNLFRDFWSPFSIYFYFSSERKKTRNRLWAVLGQDTDGRGLYKPGQASPKASRPETLTLASRAPFKVRRRLVFCAVKKKSIRRFSFSSDFPRLFSDHDF